MWQDWMKQRLKSWRLSISCAIPKSIHRLVARFQKAHYWWDLPAPVKHYWQKQWPAKRRFHSLVSADLTLSKCLLVWAPAAFVICLNRQGRKLLVSYSLMKSMPSDGREEKM